MNMYTRQESLNLNANQNIIIIGVGGVGWHTAKGLAMAGVRHIEMFDDDVIEAHNLPRLDTPFSCIGKNKATLLKSLFDQMRPENSHVAYHYKFDPDVIVNPSEFDWVIDCTDNHESQLQNQKFAADHGIKYMKIGYNGKHITISGTVAEWDTNPDGSDDGYTITPSYVAPAIIVAGLAIDMILSGELRNVSLNINEI